MMIPLRHFRRTSLNEAFIQNAKSFCRTLPTLTFPLSFTVGDGSHYVTSRSHVLSCLSRSSTPTCIGLIIQLIFPSALKRILHHFSVPFPSSDHFTVICSIDYATVKCSVAQFWSRQSDSTTPSSHSAPSWSTLFASAPSSSGDVSLEDVMAQLQRMDACLDTLSTELYQVNIRVGRIARRQAAMGGFAP